ncbi:hypothetical protein [Flagellimonas allohymeniacidonis]|uniref:Uncharacterized protein n=1 Tax=Flagellimonas allohymeniacidonis TaxID=2517819 RepID=A0A4Q8QKU7_9FLAO|nr:hypothetical protein [Allomuricauda hymeniacidonis]TAI48866.1 hypothetical protein EW142_03450 [Allomuricauda hymeniacidonis]
MKISAKVIPGHGAASGKKNDERYPSGTIALQAPFFKELGLDIYKYHPGTLNIDVAPYNINISQPKCYFENVKWTSHIPSENFYFFDIALYHLGSRYEGLIYMPDPKTKTEHEQSKSTLELLLPKIENVVYGSHVDIEIDDNQINLTL